MLILSAAARLDKRLLVSLLAGSLLVCRKRLRRLLMPHSGSTGLPAAPRPNAERVSPRTPSYHTSSHSLSAAVTQRTLFFFFFVPVQLKMSKLAALAETKEGVSWGEGGASPRLFLNYCALPSPKVAKGALLACFLTCLGLLTRGRSHSLLLHSSPQKAALCCDLLLVDCSFANLDVLDAGVDLSEAGLIIEIDCDNVALTLVC